MATEELTAEQQKALALARARLRLQQNAVEAKDGGKPKKAEFVDEAPAKPERTMWQRTGDDIAGLVRGAGSIGATLLAPKDYLEDYLEKRATGKPTGVSRNEQRRTDMTSALGLMGADTDSTAFKVFKGVGEGAGVAAMPVVRGGKYVADTAKNVLGGGAAAALINPEDVGTGATIGGALTAVGRPVGFVAKGIHENLLKPAFNLMRKGGEESIVRNYITHILGEQNIPATVRAAQQGRGFTAGYKPKTAETMVEYITNPVTGKKELVFMPEASPLSALTRTEAAERGGSSAIFGKKLAEQNRALEVADKARDVAAAPTRGTALQTANMSGGVNSRPIDDQIARMLKDPDNYGAPGVRDALNQVRKELRVIIHEGSANGYVDAKALYAFRKDLGKSIKAIYDSKKLPFDKATVGKLETEIQRAIDDGINDAIRLSGMPPNGQAGTVWDRYLKDYAKASENKKLDIARRELSENPPQKTNLGGGRDVAKEGTPQVGQMLSRPIMMTNWTLRLFGKAKEAQVDEVLTRVLTDPSEYAKIMASVNPATRAQVTRALDVLRNATIAASTSE